MGLEKNKPIWDQFNPAGQFNASAEAMFLLHDALSQGIILSEQLKERFQYSRQQVKELARRI